MEMDNDNSADVLYICRACLKYADSTFKMSHKIKESTKVIDALYSCVPELQGDIHRDSHLCFECTNYLDISFTFRERCLKSDTIIKQYLQETSIDLEMIHLDSKILADNEKSEVNICKNELTNPVVTHKCESSDNEDDVPMLEETAEVPTVTEELSYLGESTCLQNIIDNIPEINDENDMPEYIKINKFTLEDLQKLQIEMQNTKQNENIGSEQEKSEKSLVLAKQNKTKLEQFQLKCFKTGDKIMGDKLETLFNFYKGCYVNDHDYLKVGHFLLKCYICQEFKHKTDLMGHIVENHKNDKLFCCICNVFYKDLFEYNTHLSSHESYCNACNNNIAYSDLLQHSTTHTQQDMTSVKMSSGIDAKKTVFYQCTSCKIYFKYESQIISHKKHCNKKSKVKNIKVRWRRT